MRRAHGIRGELVIEPLVDEPLAIFASGRRMVGGGAEVEIVESRPFKGGLLVRLEGLTNRTEAERWRGRTLSVAESDVPQPADGALFLRELEGMAVRDTAGLAMGTVVAWYEVPSGILLDVRHGAREATIPFNEHFVRQTDRAARTLTIDIPPELWVER